MGRFATAAVQPMPRFDEGDDQFIGWNCKLDRANLRPGYFYNSNNKRVNRGVAETRPGTLTPVFANAVAFGSILGSGIYSNPNGAETILIATPTQVLMVRSGAYPTTVSIPSGVTLSGTIEFSQQFDKVLMHAPAIPATYVWDGSIENGFVPVAKQSAVAFTSVIPNVAWSVNVGYRAWIPFSADTMAASDLLDYTTFDLSLTGHKVRTNTGASDPIVGACPYAQSSLIIGKRNSYDLIINVFGDLSATQTQVLSSTVGLRARRTLKMVGGDLFGLHDTGLYQISQVIQDRLEASPTPVSDPIEPFFKQRINWNYASDAVAAVLGYYYFLAVPIDGSTVNNAVLVYNTVTKEWEGYDTWNVAAGFQIDNLFVTDFYNQKRIYAVNQAGGGSIHLLYEGKLDELAYNRGTGLHTVYEISDLFETRGYARVAGLGYLFDYRGAAELGPNEQTSLVKDWKRAEIGVLTWRPSITVTEVTDKATDERVRNATPVTKSNIGYDIAFKPDYVIDNSNSDFDAPGRQDYSVDPIGGLYPGTAGVDGDRKQAHALRFSLKTRSRYVSYRIANTQGTCDIMRVLGESSGAQVQIRRAA